MQELTSEQLQAAHKQIIREEKYFGVQHNIDNRFPAVIYNTGETEFYKFGVKHNPGQSAIVIDNNLMNQLVFNTTKIVEKNFNFGALTEIRNHRTFKRYKAGKIIKIETSNDDETTHIFYKFGLKHSERGPAEIRKQYGKFNFIRESWYKFNLLHKNYGPTITIKNLNSSEGIFKKFIKFGTYHRPHHIGPALIDTDLEVGNQKSIIYFEFGFHHNEVGPANIVFFNKPSNINELIKIDGPNLEILDKRKLAYIAEYRQFGYLHRLDGPAVIVNEATGVDFFNPKKRFFLFGHSIEESVYRELGVESIIAENSSVAEKTLKYLINYFDNILDIEFKCTIKKVFNKIHCSDGPAIVGESIIVINDKPYKFILKIWKQFGKTHRKDGPAILIQDEFGRVIREEYYQFGQRHNENGPAVVKNYFDEKLDTAEEFQAMHVSFYQFDYLHNENGPARVKFDEYGGKIEEEYYQFNKLHNDDGPARIEYFSDGCISKERSYRFGYLHSQSKYGWGPSVKIFKKTETDEYFLSKVEYHYSDLLHNENGPARVYYNPDGSIRKQIWFMYGYKHRLDGPAWVERNTDGRIILKKYFIMNKFHRLNGPAIIEDSGYYQMWCLFGQKIFKSAGCCIGSPRMDQEIIAEIRKYFGAIGRNIPPELQKEIKKKEREFQLKRTQEQNILINLNQDDKGETL